ncbi:hypothetical protein CLV24_107129 [Pontibacter ummariensis]|uniref:Uncharacterized protein n=1 Tax=Pontibacter ummariensis TaxID=1610492 RepID=A0A239ESV9_9BACT|nr:hypothetical protein CLV24_107129 [Pontibacter ummariensis]SNS47850.1 hypothetical protein SAMN06296052_10759 [Pontibacter ummariensis]
MHCNSLNTPTTFLVFNNSNKPSLFKRFLLNFFNDKNFKNIF